MSIRISWSAIGSVVISLAATQLAWSAIIYQRALPTANLNEAAGANRSNINWAEASGNPQPFIGDNFQLPNTSAMWKINSITTFSVASGGPLGSEFSSVTLYLAQSGTNLASVMSGTLSLGSSTSSNPNITHTPITYGNGQTYEDPFAGFFPLWQHVFDFSSSNLILSSAVAYNFATYGVGVSPDNRTGFGLWFTHASNGSLSGSTQDGADNNYLLFANVNDLSTSFNPAFINSLTVGDWDKGSDINIIIDATPFAAGVPEPGTITLLGAGLGALMLLRRRRRR